MLDNHEMATAIRHAIESSGKTQKEIADAFGVTEQAVSGWLRTGKVDKRKLPALAVLTGRPLSHFGMGDPAVQVVEQVVEPEIDPTDVFMGALELLPQGEREAAASILAQLARTPDSQPMRDALKAIVSSPRKDKHDPVG